MKKKLDYWQQACRHLCQVDPILSKIIKSYKNEYLYSKENAFTTLVNCIVGQQISVAAADAIWRRLSKLCAYRISPNKIQKLSKEELAAIGLSKQKISYLGILSEYFLENKITNKYFSGRDFEEVYQELIKLKGIGKWSCQMFGIFYLGDPDLLPLGDIGLIKSIEKNYAQGKKLSLEKIEKLAAKWQPYRTAATWFLWRDLDPHPVTY